MTPVVDVFMPGIVATLDDEALMLRSERPLRILSSAVVGGGDVSARVIINRHVNRNYHHPRPAQDLRAFARRRGVQEPFVGLMTAVFLHETHITHVQADSLALTVILTAGLGNATAVGLSSDFVSAPGTINIILLLNAHLAPAARVNAIMMATEAKTALLHQWDVRTPDGLPATGTSTDAVVLACTGQGSRLSFAGPVTPVGRLIGTGVRRAMEASHA